MGRKITLRNRLAIQAAFNTTSLKGMVRLITRVIQTTVLIEGIGALVLFFVFLKEGFSPWRAFGYGVFHSVSAFCNAGFDLIGNKSLLPCNQYSAESDADDSYNLGRYWLFCMEQFGGMVSLPFIPQAKTQGAIVASQPTGSCYNRHFNRRRCASFFSV